MVTVLQKLESVYTRILKKYEIMTIFINTLENFKNPSACHYPTLLIWFFFVILELILVHTLEF